MEQVIKSKINPISPAYLELIESVINAACEWYTVTRDQLMTEHKLANARHICCYIINRSTPGMYDYDIGRFFGTQRVTVRYAVEKIDSHKNIYSQVLVDINGIIGLANTFEKKYTWHIQSINTTH